MKNTNLVADADGYYLMQLSDLNRPNVNGLFKLSLTELDIAAINSRAKNGMLIGEVGHPVRKEGTDSRTYMKRCVEVSLDEVGLQIKEIFAEFVNNPDEYTGGPVQRITGLVKPYGPKKEALEKRLLENEPIYLGMRAITHPPKDSTDHVEIHNVISWDLIDNDPYPRGTNEEITNHACCQ